MVTKDQCHRHPTLVNGERVASENPSIRSREWSSYSRYAWSGYHVEPAQGRLKSFDAGLVIVAGSTDCGGS